MIRKDRPDYIDDIREGSRAARAVGWRAGIWLLIIIAFAAIISGGIWALKVATSDVKGRGDQTRQVNSGNNRIAAQEMFQTLYNQIQAYDQELDQAAADKREHPGDSTFATNYSGMVKVCLDAVAQYDAAANQVTKAKWRDPALPYQIDRTNPATDCKENR